MDYYIEITKQSNPGTNLAKLTQPTTFQILPKKLENLEDFSQKYKNAIKKETEKKHELTDREVSFRESPETDNIVAKCTKSDVLEWIKNNPKISFEIMYKTCINYCKF